IEKAARALLASTDHSVLEVALDHGFSSAATFARAFRARFGMTATEWRGRRRAVAVATPQDGQTGSQGGQSAAPRRPAYWRHASATIADGSGSRATPVSGGLHALRRPVRRARHPRALGAVSPLDGDAGPSGRDDAHAGSGV